MDRASEKLDTLGVITTAVENAEHYLSFCGVKMDEPGPDGNITLSMPIHGGDRISGASINVDNANVNGGELQISLDIEFNSSGREISSAVSAGEDEDSENSQHDLSASSPSDKSSPSVSTEDSVELTEENTTETTGNGTEMSTVGSPTEVAGNSKNINAEANGAAHSDGEYVVYRDPDALSEVYDPDATFKEMTAELGVDVTPQTVRKYMIKHGIHEPEPRMDRLLESIQEADLQQATHDSENNPDVDTAGETDSNEDHPSDPPVSSASTDRLSTTDSTEEFGAAGKSKNTFVDTEPPSRKSQTDGGKKISAVDPVLNNIDNSTESSINSVPPLALPNGLTVKRLFDVMTTSRTVYEVQGRLNLKPEQTRSLLRRYDLIDLVTGRITGESTSPTEEEVAARLIKAYNDSDDATL